MKVRVCFHDQCFDGACSAAVFTRFYHSCVNSEAEILYRGLVHRAGQLFDEDFFDGDENAIVDFKYSSSDKLNWWFDHHQSAFLTPADAEHFPATFEAVVDERLDARVQARHVTPAGQDP